MEPNRKRPSTKKDSNRTDASTFTKYSSQPFARPPTTGTSSSSSEDRSTSVKSSDNTSLEDQIEIVMAPNDGAKELVYPSTAFKISRNNTKEGLSLKFDSAPSAYFTAMRNDLPIDVNLSPQDSFRIPSPASISSLTSRPLEWDSGADVGYIASGIETGLSTIERIALAQGSAILLPRSDPEGTTETSAKPVAKIANPAIEKLIGTPAAESTVIKDKFSSPVPGSKLFCPEGISPIVAANVHTIPREAPVETRDNEVKLLEPQFQNLSLEENNAALIQPVLSSISVSEMHAHDLNPDLMNNVETKDPSKKNGVEDNSHVTDSPDDVFSSKEDRRFIECLLEVDAEKAPSEHLLGLKKSASCSNLLQVSQPVDLRFLKPLKRHFQNSASSSSISTVIDRSKKKTRKLFATSTSISEKTEMRSKQFKSPRKILSPSKKFHLSSIGNKMVHSSSPPKVLPKPHDSPPDIQKTTENSQIAFHTSIQQSILDELQQCVNEISHNFNSGQKHTVSGRVGSSVNHKSKRGSGSTQENCSTLESVASVQTNESWTPDSNAKDSLTSAEKAKSFEYLPGDIYERNSSECFQSRKKIESSSTTSEKFDFSESSKDEFWNLSSMNLFERELERGVNLLKDFINNSTSFDSRKKQLLVKRIAKKLISIEYESYRKSATNEHPATNQSPTAGTSGTYLRDHFSFKQQPNKKSSELSGSTQISQSYIDSTSGSSCLNLVMRPLKKSTSVESSSDHPEKLSSGIRHIQENYRSNNCAFDSCGKVVNNYNLVNETTVHEPRARTVTGQEGCSMLQDKKRPGNSPVEWSKSSCSTGNQQRVFYSSEYRLLNNDPPSKNHYVRSTNHQKLSKFQEINKKKTGGSRILNENSDVLLDGRTVNLNRDGFKPFLNSDNDGSTKEYSEYRAWQDWRKPTSDSERRYEEKLDSRNEEKKESKLLYKYLDAERRNHLLWIQSEINHLSNLKALIEKQERLKEGFKVLKNKKVDAKGDSRTKNKSASCMKKSGVFNSDESSTNFCNEASDLQKTFRPSSCSISSNSSDKENKNVSNKSFVKKTRAATSRSRFGVSPSMNQPPREISKSQVSSNDSRYISADSNVTNDTWAEDSDKFFDKNFKKGVSTSGKQKKNVSVHKNTSKPISYTILFDPPKSAPPPTYQIPSHKIIKNVESSLNSKKPEPSLQECLAKKHPEIIRRVEFRRNCIAELASSRQLLNERKKQLVLACSSSENVFQNSSIFLPSLKEKRIFSQKKLRQQTEKKYRQCFEVKQKVKEQKTKEEYRTNRLMAETFARKLQRKVLKGQVDLSNSVMVIGG